MLTKAIYLLLLFCYCNGDVSNYDPCADPDPSAISGTFPDNFIWSAATAAYQVEGGWNANGKGPSIWDTFMHQVPSPAKGNATGDVACDSYDKWMTDIQMLKNLNLKYYRMSISWSRLVPNGIVGPDGMNGVNPDGVRYYGNLFSNLTANGIQPMVTLYHWDLPQALQNMGGWINDSSSDWFAGYANLSFHLFGDKVKFWITFNEPWVFALSGYSSKTFAPGVSDCPGTCPYQAAHNVIKSHAKAYRIYDQYWRSTQNGKVGITFNCDYKISASQNPEDINATYRAMQFQLGWFAHPIYKDGDYPPIMRAVIDSRSKAENLSVSRLPQFTAAEKAYINGSFDYFGLNTYTSFLVTNAPNDPTQQTVATYNADMQINSTQCPSWQASASSWLKFTPWGTRGLLNWIKNEYNNPILIITENGWSDTNGSIADTWRSNFFNQYLHNILKAIKKDNCNVHGYTAWSLMDNLEWTSGFTEKFGIHFVNFSDPNRPRTVKNSALYYASVVAKNGFPTSTSHQTRSSVSTAALMVFMVFLMIYS